MRTASTILLKFMPFWAFLLFFKFAATLHYTLLAPFGEQLLPLWIVGILIGGESLIQVVFDLPAGYLLDYFGYRRLLKYTTAFFMVAALCIALGLTQTTYLLTVFFSIFGWLFYMPGMNAYILSHADEKESGRFFSIRDISNSIGVVGASISLPFLLLLSPKIAGVALLVLLLVSFCFLLLSPADKQLPPRHERTTHQRRHARGHSLRTLWHTMQRLNPASGMLVLLTFAGSLFYGIIWFTVPLVIAQEQAGAGLLGIGLGVFDFSIVVLGYLIGRMADKGDKRIFVFFGLLIFALCGMAAGANLGILFIFFGFFATAGDEMAGVSLWSWLHHLDREHDSDGTVSGVITLFEDLGYGIGPILAGVLYVVAGPQLTIAVGALPILIVWVLYYALVHKHFPYEVLYALVPQRPHRRRHKS
ncbi:MAG: MFS transporter [Patescibacteria group bacterium]